MKRVFRLELVVVVLVGVVVLAMLVTGRTQSKHLGPGQGPTQGSSRVLSDQPESTVVPAATLRPTTEPGLTSNGPTSSPGESTPTLQSDDTGNSSDSPVQLTLPAVLPALDPTKWQDWPVLPGVSSELRQIYLHGLEQGNNPHAFSILGDCQSEPDVFLGVFDDSSYDVKVLPESLQETIAQFSGSFNRYSPTVKKGATEGALLWGEWNDNLEKKCNKGETPLDCELRVHKPSIVFIHVGTHYEDRNRRYLVTILDRILKTNAIPVFVTKADNLERDGRINAMIASLASEYHLPLWNFWASVQSLPNNGLKVEDSKYLTDAGIEVHRRGALEVLDTVWHGLK